MTLIYGYWIDITNRRTEKFVKIAFAHTKNVDRQIIPQSKDNTYSLLLYQGSPDTAGVWRTQRVHPHGVCGQNAARPKRNSNSWTDTGTCTSYLPTHLPTYLLTYRPTYLTTHLPTYLPTYLLGLLAETFLFLFFYFLLSLSFFLSSSLFFLLAFFVLS